MPSGSVPPDASIDNLAVWKAAGEAGDTAAALRALSSDVELISPITGRFVFRGADEIANLLDCVFEVVSDYRYRDDIRQGDRAFLSATTVVRGVDVEEFQRIELNPSGQLRRITLAMRPLTALTAFARALGPAIARGQGSRSNARTLALASGFLHSIASTGDERFIPLAAPKGSPTS
jgi:hypothetical protein